MFQAILMLILLVVIVFALWSVHPGFGMAAAAFFGLGLIAAVNQ